MISHITSININLYRRQFILGNHYFSDFNNWQLISFGDFALSIHPDLQMTVSKVDEREFLLLGFALNHNLPEANNQQILDNIARSCFNIEELFEYCHDLCGRYVILFQFPEKTGLVTDLIGSRSVYWCVHQDTIWCASQPSTLAWLLSIEEIRSREISSYINQDMVSIEKGEAAWIGDGTKYVGIKHLLPNYYLDFCEKKAIRYWPKAPLEQLDVDSASRKGTEILKNTMQAATNRFQMSMAITAGWDSRTMLAATRSINYKIYYYIQKFGGMTDSHPDIRIPRKLTKKLGIPFHIIECVDYQDEEFDAILDKNVFMLHNPAKKVLLRSFFLKFQGKVNASGNISDLCRTPYGNQPVHDIFDLLENVNLKDSEYAVKSLMEWYAETKFFCETFGYNQRDLFFWEQVLGNWGSMFAAELDIAIDEFYPFGTRRLVETILAVDEKWRPYHNSKVHRRIIELLWPELLSEPINPINWYSDTIKFLRMKGKRTMARLGLLSMIKSFRSRVSSW